MKKLKIEYLEILETFLGMKKKKFNISQYEEEEIYYEPVTVSNFRNNIYIEYESNSDENKKLAAEEYLFKIRPNLNNIIISKTKTCGKFN